MEYDVDYAEMSKDQVRNTSVWTSFPTVTMGREEFNPPLQSKNISALEATWHENMSELVKKAISDVCTTWYYAAADGIRNSSFLFVKDAITTKFNQGILYEMLYRSFEQYPPVEAFFSSLDWWSRQQFGLYGACPCIFHIVCNQCNRKRS